MSNLQGKGGCPAAKQCIQKKMNCPCAGGARKELARRPDRPALAVLQSVAGDRSKRTVPVVPKISVSRTTNTTCQPSTNFTKLTSTVGSGDSGNYTAASARTWSRNTTAQVGVTVPKIMIAQTVNPRLTSTNSMKLSSTVRSGARANYSASSARSASTTSTTPQVGFPLGNPIAESTVIGHSKRPSKSQSSKYTLEVDIPHIKKAKSISSSIDNNLRRSVSNASEIQRSRSSSSQLTESNYGDYGFHFDSKITMSRQTISPSFECDDDVFVDGAEFFKKNNSECSWDSAVSLSSNSSQKSTTSQQKPAIKYTLQKQLQERRKSYISAGCDIYVAEYIDDILKYLIINQANYLLNRHDFSNILQFQRAITIDWLMDISCMYKVTGDVFYKMVRLFDYVVVNLKLSMSSYKLAAITCFWIVFKFHNNVDVVKASTVAVLCEKGYTRTEILTFERKIFDITEFKLPLTEPHTFLHSYLKRMDCQSNELLIHASNFVIDCAMFFEHFLRINATQLAQCALFIAYNIVTGGERKAYFISGFPDWNRTALKFHTQIIVNDIKSVIKTTKFPLRHIINIYNSRNKLYVYKYFLNNLD